MAFDRNRRTLLQGLSVLPLLTLSADLAAQTSATGIRLKKIHTFELRVSDVARTVKFYQELFGMPVISTFGGRTCLGVGSSEQFMSVRSLEPGEEPAITQLGYSVEGFSIDDLQSRLALAGITPIDAPSIGEPGLSNANHSWVRSREGTPELYFSDGRGVIVQLSDSSYCGGSGPLGANCPAPQIPSPGLFDLTEISHFTAFVNDGVGANKFYQDNFGLEVQAWQGPGSPVTGIGDGLQFVMYAGPFPGGEDATANIDHGCFNMKGFEVDAVLAKLDDYGFSEGSGRHPGPLKHYISLRMPERGGAEGGTPELYFTDPDGILMQLQDVSYCGGGGYLGNECIV